MTTSTITLLNRLAKHALDAPHAVAYRFVASDADDARSITWSELDRAVARAASRLVKSLAAGSTLLISSANCLAYPVAVLAAWRAGLRLFAVSAELSPVEVTKLSRDAEVSAAVVGASRAAEAIAQSISRVWSIDSVLDEEETTSTPPRDGAALLLQSSGTTGFPKVVQRSARSIDAVSDAMVEAIGFTPQDHVLATLPLSHSYGIEHGLLAPVWAGSSVTLMNGLDVRTLTRELGSGGATILPTVPGVIEILADLPEPARVPRLRRIYSAGGPLPAGVFHRFYDRYKVRVSQLYGATEVGSVTYADPDAADFGPASVGAPMRGVSVRIVDPLHPSRSLGIDAEGHVAIRADSMFDGYVADGDPLPLVDGHFLTGDLGKLDARGRLTITGRLKLLIEVGGMKVNPLEVESVLREHPSVGTCVVVPIRQSETMFRVKAVVTPRDPKRPPAIDELRALARERLATYKVPRVFEVREKLPTTATGKVLRHLVEAT